jgi:dTMP kinase
MFRSCRAFRETSKREWLGRRHNFKFASPGVRAADSAPVPAGFFISFEGSEGCGKTTQIRRLAARLSALGRTVVQTREPGGTPIGEAIRELLQFSHASRGMKAETELLLFTASRAQLTREVIEPALAAGAIVIADRFLDSTTVYQGVARRIDPATVRAINEFAIGGCRPEVTFVLDLETAQARERLHQRIRTADARPDRMENEPQDFYERVRTGYLRLADAEPNRIRVLNGGATIEEIEAKIWDQLESLLSLEPGR